MYAWPKEKVSGRHVEMAVMDDPVSGEMIVQPLRYQEG